MAGRAACRFNILAAAKSLHHRQPCPPYAAIEYVVAESLLIKGWRVSRDSHHAVRMMPAFLADSGTRLYTDWYM